MRSPRIVILCWFIIVAVSIGVGVGVFDRLTSSVRAVPGSESMRASQYLERAAPESESISAVVWGGTVTDPPIRAQVEAAVAGVRTVPGIATVPDPYRTPGLVSADRQALIIPVTFAAGLNKAALTSAVRSAAERLDRIAGAQIRVSGGALLHDELTHQARRDVERAELLSLPIVLILLIVIFGGAIAASFPLAVAIVGATTTLLVLYVFSLLTDVSVYAVQVPTMLGLGLAVDYGLLIVTRFREEYARQPVLPTAIAATVHGAGRTILFSGLTVAVSLTGVMVFPSPFLRSLGLAASVVVVVDMLASITLVPALLALFGHRIAEKRANPRQGAVFAHLARLSLRAPAAILVVVTAALLVLASPAANLRLTNGGAASLPGSSVARQYYDVVNAHFPSGVISDPVLVVVGAGVDAGTADRLRALPGVSSATRQGLPDGATLLRLWPAGTSDGLVATGLVRKIRELRAGQAVQVTGSAAQLVDYEHMIGTYAPWAVVMVSVAILVLLFAFTGSVLVPVRTFFTTLLSLGAALGVTVWVLQDGHLAGLVGAERHGALNLIAPPLIISLAFGLAMDYEIFILARMRDAWIRTGDQRESIVTGLRLAGRVVTAAALLIIVVFASFMTGGFAPAQELGLGLALAVLIDATVVRMVLVPATMALLGRWAWWAPGPLRRLHARVGLVEEPEPAAGDHQ